jgi:hypothetical protein
MFKFLQTIEGQNATAIVCVLVIGFALLIGAHPFRKKQRLVVTSPENMSLWTAGDYFTWVQSKVLAAENMDKLEETMGLIDGFHDKPFRVPINRFAVNKYYIRLLDAYAEKEKELYNIPIELCKN